MSDMKPTPEDLARDAAADTAVCEAATDPPWDEQGDGAVVASIFGSPDTIADCTWPGDNPTTRANAAFIALSRTALPAWIRRAIAAEAEVARLKQAIADLRTHYEDEPDYCE